MRSEQGKSEERSFFVSSIAERTRFDGEPSLADDGTSLSSFSFAHSSVHPSARLCQHAHALLATSDGPLNTDGKLGGRGKRHVRGR